ncbi:GDP-mannose 4,6-dehydratase [Nocardioides sp.]|uniref:GDP-mannose 4,6-dehydratase n=1 Tax=Nocardioides sp. TaxID=35761 RepID=UPI0035297335
MSPSAATWRPTRALVTGVGGQDGGYLAERLVAAGVEVHGLQPPGEPAPPWCPSAVVLHAGDLTEHATTDRLVRDLAPDLVVNLAGQSSVARSWAEPEPTWAVNAAAAEALVSSVAALPGSPRFVQASSAEIFGRPDRCPQDESTPLRPVSPYGRAKAHAHLAVGRARAEGLHASSMILYNHESPRRPPSFVTRKISQGVAAIAAGRADRLVLGTLDARRDWGWAPDYVDAMLRAAHADSPADYVVATGRSHSVREFVAAAFARAGIGDWAPLVTVDPSLARPVDPVDSCGDASRARDLLGWAPTVGFPELVHRMVDADLAALS